jgi:hypothetical protein
MMLFPIFGDGRHLILSAASSKLSVIILPYLRSWAALGYAEAERTGNTTKIKAESVGISLVFNSCSCRMTYLLRHGSLSSNAAPEWQARSCCYGNRLDGRLSTPGECWMSFIMTPAYWMVKTSSGFLVPSPAAWLLAASGHGLMPHKLYTGDPSVAF